MESIWDAQNRNYIIMGEQGQSWGRRKVCAVFWQCSGRGSWDGGSVLKQNIIEKVVILFEEMDWGMR